MSNLFMLSLVSDRIWPYVILGVYIIAMIGIAVFSHKKSSSLTSFYLSNRNMGGWMSAFAYGTTYFSAVIFIGYAGKFGLTMGLSAFWIGVANAFVGAMLAWIVLAKRTRFMSHALEAKTMPEFFEKRYGSKYVKLYASIVIFIFLIPYSTSVYQGLGYIFESVFGLEFKWCILIMAVVTAIYLFVGGYFAEALSDFIQGIIMIIGVVLMIVFMFKSEQVNGLEGLKKLTETGYGFFPSYDSASGKLIDSAGFNLIIMCLLTSFGIWSLPQSIHKFYTIKDDSAIKKGTVVSTIFALIIGGSAYLNGGLAHLFPNASSQPADYVIVTMFNEANFSPVLFGLIAVLVLSASMSTLSSVSLSSASTVSIDLYKGYLNKKASDQNTKIVLRILCLVFVAISAVLALLQVEAIVTLMSLSWGTIAGCFIGPYIYGLYSKKTNRVGVIASITTSLIITIGLVLTFGYLQTESGSSIGVILKSGIGRSPLIGVIAMASSMIVTPLFSLMGAKKFATPSEIIQKAFSELSGEPKASTDVAGAVEQSTEPKEVEVTIVSEQPDYNIQRKIAVATPSKIRMFYSSTEAESYLNSPKAKAKTIHVIKKIEKIEE